MKAAELIRSYKERAAYYRRMAFANHMVSVFLGVATTVADTRSCQFPLVSPVSPTA